MPGTRKMSKAHRDALVAGQKRRRERERLAAKGQAPAAAQPARVHSPAKRSPVMPHGITVLRRHGRGQDIIEGDANEIRQAVKLWREVKSRIK